MAAFEKVVNWRFVLRLHVKSRQKAGSCLVCIMLVFVVKLQFWSYPSDNAPTSLPSHDIYLVSQNCTWFSSLTSPLQFKDQQFGQLILMIVYLPHFSQKNKLQTMLRKRQQSNKTMKLPISLYSKKKSQLRFSCFLANPFNIL